MGTNALSGSRLLPPPEPQRISLVRAYPGRAVLKLLENDPAVKAAAQAYAEAVAKASAEARKKNM
jgi:hypothetical protein